MEKKLGKYNLPRLAEYLPAPLERHQLAWALLDLAVERQEGRHLPALAVVPYTRWSNPRLNKNLRYKTKRAASIHAFATFYQQGQFIR